MPMPRKQEPEIRCQACQARLVRKRFNGRLEDLSAFRRRKFCDRACMATGMLQESPTTSALRRRATKLKGDSCEKCGATEGIGIHHVDSNPANNDESNLMTLCASCHTAWHWRNGKKAPRRQGSCKVCGAPARKLDMCQKHYQRFRKYGDPCLTKIRDGSRFVLSREIPGSPNGLESEG